MTLPLIFTPYSILIYPFPPSPILSPFSSWKIFLFFPFSFVSGFPSVSLYSLQEEILFCDCLHPFSVAITKLPRLSTYKTKRLVWAHSIPDHKAQTQTAIPQDNHRVRHNPAGSTTQVKEAKQGRWFHIIAATLKATNPIVWNLNPSFLGTGSLSLPLSKPDKDSLRTSYAEKQKGEKAGI